MKTSAILSIGIAIALAGCSGPTEAPEAPEAGEETGTPSKMDAHAGHRMKISEQEAAKKQEIVQVLVERFDAQGCAGADVIGTMRRTEASGAESFLRAYQASVSCSDEVKAALTSDDFSETEPGLYASETEDGMTERVSIRVAPDGSAAGIEWEIDQK